jgi:hypothetical protein
MPNYSNGKIYTIRFHNSNEIYIGSTIQSLAVRFGGHKKSQDTSLYYLINDKYNGNWNECYYELYENYSCNNREELCKKEGEVIRQFKNDENYDCINCVIAGRTAKEYEEDRKGSRKEYKKEKGKEYREKNKESIEKKKKEFYELNKEILNEKQKEYYNKNKEIINEKLKEKIKCECGFIIRKGGLKEHKQSKKHIELMSQNNWSSIIQKMSPGLRDTIVK